MESQFKSATAADADSVVELYSDLLWLPAGRVQQPDEFAKTFKPRDLAVLPWLLALVVLAFTAGMMMGRGA